MIYFLVLVFLPCVFSIFYGPQPKIVSSNGHLIFKAANHKNISFETQGLGRVHLNGIDLTNAAEISNSALQAMEKYKTTFENSFEKIIKFEQLIDGNEGILQKLLLMENSSKNSSNITLNPVFLRSIRRVNRRILVLSRAIRTITNLLDKDECLNNPCKNGGTCQDMFNSFLCHCPSEWEGSICDKDVNECTRFIGTDLGCQNGATCINRQGSYECLCSHGWFGLHCTRRSADCSSGSSTDICGHGTCVSQNTEAGYKCLCDQGWRTDGSNLACTHDVDECKMNKPPCSVNPPVPCINVPGSFYCGSCPAGYTGNGYYCTDIDECSIFNGGCSVIPMVQCVNTPGSRICGPCPPGYQGNGISCSYQGVCNVNNGGCHSLATCRHNPQISSSFVECICPVGHTGNGLGPNGCVPSTQTSNSCTPNPCKNGLCLPNDTTGYHCICSRRFTGRNCDIIRDPCTPNPCQNGGTCQPIFARFKCFCTNIFTGPRCEEERQACGGRLKVESGVLKYPATESETYEHRISCAWTIETNITKILNITFTRFNLETSRNCQYDWLQIHDGKNTAAHSLGRFCGSKLPNGGVITSTHNVIYLWFRSDHSIAKTGFELNWNSTDPVCGEVLVVTSHGTIYSPGSPGNYPVNRDCYWTLTAPLGKRLLFHFFSLLIGNNSNCDGDYLEFISGSLPTDTIFAKFCNTSRPSPLYSSGPEVLVHFHSDAIKSYPGFQITYSVVEGIPGCGGVYTMDHGEIQSPRIDGKYPSDIICEYKIVLTENSRIKITFLSFSLEESTSCQFDYLSIHAGSNSDAPLIGRYCGKKIPATFVSHSNSLLIVFKTDWAKTDEGFRLKYETICGGKYTNPSGVIESPGYPNQYGAEQICIHEIIQAPGTSIQLNIIDLDIEHISHPECAYDFLEIRDGDNENSTLIGKYCKKTPSTIFSSFNYLWIKFQTSSIVIGKGFKLSYNTTNLGCGGIMKDKIGTISSSEYPDVYPSKSKCKWIISAPPGNVIQIVWINFNLEQSYKCSYDSVSVYDNNTETGMGGLMGSFCGYTLPPMLLSSSNIVTIFFKTDSTINLDGFLLSYNFVQETNVCGGNYFTPAGVIKSPGYPSNYPTNRECSWTITVQAGQQIMLNITDFNIESYSNCRYDWLEIHNGGSAASPLLGKYCGKNIPKLIPSHANKLFLFFKSDMTKSGHGFKIYWDSTTTGCGGSLTSPSGSIISPHYPEPYNSNTECIWTISTSAGSILQIVFADLDLENHANCVLDYIELFDGPTLNSKSLGKFCSNHPAFLRSTSNHVLVKFRSDISYQGRGFQLQYTTVCHNNVTGFRGVIESPNFPNGYPHNQDCLWNIKVPSKNKINITFSHFELERSLTYVNQSFKNCAYDYVEIKYEEVDNYDERDQFISYGTYCGDKSPQFMTLNSDHVQIHFVTDNLLLGSGFRLEWQLEGCGGVFNRPEGTIKSPNYPNGYPAFIQCQWKIEVDYGNSVEILFNFIDIEKDTACDYDYIEIFNGPDNTYPLISKFCHQDHPTTVSTSGNFMFVQFSADSSYQGRGFTANYSMQPTKCGGKLTTSQGHIYSPNYPKNYDRNDTCGWLIDIEEGHRIELIFEDVDLPRRGFQPCNNNYIKVFDGPTSAYPVMEQVCGNVKPNRTITSTYNHMYVELKTDAFLVAKGFKAKYNKACGARLDSSETGTIKISPNSLPMEDMENCSWTIVAQPPNKHVSLTISHLDSQYYPCDNTFTLNIYNGETEDAPLLGQYCGTKIPPMITSAGPTMHIVANTNTDFFATYSVYDSTCGGNLTSLDGFFSSPGYPKKYPQETECEWLLHIAQGNQVGINFIELDMPQSDNCNTDYLEIRKNDASGDLLGYFCGNNAPDNITHVGSLWFYLKTSKIEDINPFKGFYVEYAAVHENDLSGPSGTIESPLYPKSYLFYGDFSWRITVDFGKRILLTFVEFYLEIYAENTCFFAQLEVFDGVDETAPNLGKFCGLNKPNPIKSSSNVIFIKISFSSTKSSTQFVLKWLQIDKESIVTTSPRSLVKGCGKGDIIDINSLRHYTLTSPGYPNGYQNNLNCEWIFTTTPGNHLIIYFSDISFAQHFLITSCYLDFVEIFQRTLEQDKWQSIKRVCSANATSEIHTTNLMKIVFITNTFYNGSGFSAEIREACGGALRESSGVIVFGNSTVQNYECQWNVTVRPGKTIEVQFLNLDINNADNCKNYLMLRNGHSANSPILGNGRYCRVDSQTSLKTTGNQLYVKYKGSPSVKGFKLSYKEVSFLCGEELSLNQFMNSTTITSPNYPNIPPPHTECSWIIRGPPGESLRVDFEERFDLTYTKGCTEERVEIRDGGTIYSPLVGIYCKDMPSSQFSTDNMIFIKFFTDVEDPKNGFKIRISLAKCGGTIRANKGVVKSPFFGVKNMYPKNINCTWRIIGKADHSLTISFNKIDLDIIENCTNIDSVTISEISKLNNKETIFGKYCGNTNPPEISTSGNEAIVHFQTGYKTHLLGGFSLTFNSSVKTCGGKIEATSGTFESPGYPVINHEFRRNCEWIIKVPEGRRVKVELLDFDLDTNNKLREQGLAFFNTANFRSTIAFLSGESTLRTIRSSENTMWVFYWTTSSSHHRGFKAKFSSDEQTICIGDFTQNEGIITAPKNISSSYRCSWSRNSVNFLNQTLALSINANFNTNGKFKSNCYFSLNNIIVGSDDMKVLTDVCRTTKNPVLVRSPLPTTKIIANQNVDTFTVNFTISYKVHPCGGIVTKEMGVIHSPNFPNKYPELIECSWLLQLPKEQAIKVTFTNLNLGNDCDKSYIVIYNGDLPTKPKIGKYCGNTISQIIQSETNNLWIDYHSDPDGDGKGFSFDFEPIIEGCGGTFHDSSRIIQSSKYPKEYPNNAECSWEVISKEGYHIGLSFISRFHIEETKNCENDFLEVSDWVNDQWVSLGKFCGREIPKQLNSTSNKMKILFRSNDKITGGGFRAKWELNCGGTFIATTTPKYIVSPGYPVSYSPNLFCQYNISAPGKIINVIFEDFQLERSSPDCRFDNVVITHKRFTHSTPFLSDTYCGLQKPPDMRFMNSILITFKTDLWVNRKGFKFYFIEESCGANITSPTMIVSPTLAIPRKPISYPTSITCTWNVFAPKNQIVVVQFEKFHIEWRSGCYFDSISIYDTTNVTLSNRLVVLCGDLNSNLPNIKSRSDSLSIILKADRTSNFEGIKANVYFTHGPKEGCGGTINLTEFKTLNSPNLQDLDCTWSVHAATGNNIQIKFTELNLRKNCGESKNHTHHCTCSFIEIRDGGGPLSETIERLCEISSSRGLEREFITSGNTALIRSFISGAGNNAFKLTLKPLLSQCGPSYLNVTKEIKVLTSPNYPSSYPDNIRCSWLLKAPNPQDRIVIHFTDFDMVDEPSSVTFCNKDKLQITEDHNIHVINDGLGPSNVLSGKKKTISSFMPYPFIAGTYQFCGKSDFPFDYYSQKNTMLLSFMSEKYESGKGKGFKLEYHIIGCNRNYTSEQGRIIGSKMSEKHCYILIKVPKNYTISLYFEYLIVYNGLLHSNCDKSGLEIYDGENNSGNQLLRTCGASLPNPVFSRTNHLWIHVWYLDQVPFSPVYDMVYTSSDQGIGCGGTLYNYKGKFSSPYYPNDFRNDTLCTWNVRVPVGMRTSITFTNFEIQGLCDNNYLKITTYENNEPNEHKFCKNDNPATLYSDSHLTVTYKSSIHNGGNGWLAVFEAVSDGR